MSVKLANEIEKFKNGEITAEDLYDSARWCTHEIKEELVEQTRWNCLYEWVVEDEDKRLWKFSRYLGSTECQEDEDFDGDVIEVEPYKKVVIDYRPIKKEGV